MGSIPSSHAAPTATPPGSHGSRVFLTQMLFLQQGAGPQSQASLQAWPLSSLHVLFFPTVSTHQRPGGQPGLPQWNTSIFGFEVHLLR